MIDIDKYEGHLSDLKEVAKTLEQHRATYALLRDAPLLLEEVKRLREENETLFLHLDTYRKMDWEYECLWTWLAENTNLLNTIEPLMEEWKKEYDEE